MPNPGDIIGGRYQIMNELGSGGFGTTYLAKDMELPNKPRCVVKQLQPRFNSPALLQNAKERFVTEAMVLQRLGNHDQIPQLMTHLEEDREFYLVQEFIDGEELRREVSRQLLNETQAISLLRDVLEVLDFVHRQGVIHRDIKPSNLIRRRQDGKIVLIDFGAVKELETLSFNAETQTLMTSAIGTPGYMAPEQQNGRPVYNSDIYALGRTAIYALTGQSPIDLEDTGTGDLKNWQKFVSISPKLVTILTKMVQPRYTERYHSASEVLHDLEPLLKIGQTVGGRYKITCYLGGGAWSYTYLADNLWRRYQSPCVIKQLKSQINNSSNLQEAERRFSTELTVLERLGDYSQIPKLWDHFEEEGEFFLVQEFINGEDLSHELQAGKRLSAGKVVDILQDVLEILDFIHKHRVIHRDIKPSNLIRRRSDDKIVLIDFGIVKEIIHVPVDEKGAGSSTQPIGTEGYMAPEQMAGRPAFGSDIYALGMTAIQALTGVYPDQFLTNPQTGEVIWQEGLQVEPKLAKILDKMVSLDLAKRYQSAAEVLKVIQNYKKPKSPTQLSQLKPWQKYSLVGLGLFGSLVFVLYAIKLNQISFLFQQGDLKAESNDPNDYKAAINYYNEGLAKAPLFANSLLNFEKAWIQKAFAYSKLQDYERMLQACEGAIALNENSVYGWNCKGSALEGLKQYPEAINSYSKVIDINPEFFDSWHNRGQLYIKLGKKDEAIQDLKQAIKVNEKESYVTWNDLGQLYYQSTDYPQAINAYQQAIRVKSDYMPAWIGLGNVQKQLGQYKEAINTYEQALKINDQSYEAWYGKGLAEEALQQYQEALNSYQRAIFIKTNYKEAIEAYQRVSKKL
jgi:serine/threonine protein kinase